MAIRAENKLDNIDRKAWTHLPGLYIYVHIISFKNPALISSLPQIVNVLNISQINSLHSNREKGMERE